MSTGRRCPRENHGAFGLAPDLPFQSAMLASADYFAAGPAVDVTVRNLPAIERVVAVVRDAARGAVRHFRHPGPYVVTAEGLPGGRVFVTVRLGHAASAPEWGLLGEDLEGTVRDAFALLRTDRRVAC